MAQDTIRVNLPDGRVVHFPSTMAPADIEQAITTMDAPAVEQPKAARSLGGFAENVGKSGVRFLKDTFAGIQGFPQLIEMANTAGPSGDPLKRAELAGTLWDALKAAPAALYARYGSLENLKKTVYEDPVGVLSDISTVAGVGASAKVPRIAGTLGKIEAATNPLKAVTVPLAAGADAASSAVIRGTLRPSAAIRGDFGGTTGVVDAVKNNRVFSEASAQGKLTESVAEAEKLIADAQAAGVPGVSRRNVTRALQGEPTTKATLRSRLEVADARPDIAATNRAIRRNNPAEIPLTDAQKLKREAQELAYEAGADNLSVKKAQQQAIARAFREGIEERVPAVAPVNQQSQDLLGAQRAFQEAQDRPQALSNMMALGTGATYGGSTGDIFGALVSAGLMKGLNSPRGGAMAGIGINELGKAGINPELLRAALVARMTGGDDQQ